MEAKWRKMRKGVLGGCVGIVVIACVTGGCFGGESAMALDSQKNCNDVLDVNGGVYNPSLKKACEDYDSNRLISHGALWLSNTKEIVGGEYNPDYLSSKVTTDEINGNEVKVFLRGTIIGGTDGKSNNAECIELSVKRGSKVYTPFDLSGYANLDTSAPSCSIDLTQDGSKKRIIENNYYVVRNENGNPFKNNIIFSELSVGLDVSNISQWGGGATRDGGRIDYNDVQVDVYRCFADHRSEVSDSGYPYCASSESMVKIGGDLMSVKSTVSSGNKSKDTGEVVNSTVAVGPLVLDGCETGCNVTFKHEVIVKSGYKFGQRFYRKIGNYINRQVATADTGVVVEGFFSFESNDKVYNKTVKLYPGEIYCSKMDYGIGTSSSDHGVIQNTSVCAMVRGTLRTGISPNVEGEKGAPLYQFELSNIYYVAPNRKYYVGGSYISNTQKAHGLKINEGVIGDKGFGPDPSVSVSDWWKLMGTRKETKTLGERMSWSNTVLLRDGGDVVGSRSFVVGSRCDNDVLRGDYGEEWKCVIQNVKEYDFSFAGEKKALTLETEVSESGSGAVPSSIVFKSSSNVKNNPFLMAEIQTNEVSNALSLWVPYNFKNSTWVEGGGMKNIDLGSDFNIEYHVRVGDRRNTTLGGDPYATQVDNATSGVYWCKARKDQINNDRPDDVCEEEKYETKIYKDNDGHEQETLFPNSDNNNLRSVAIEQGDLINQGVKVGDIICAWSWVTPSEPLRSLQMSPTWDDSNTAYSWEDKSSENKKVCGQIGKSPTIQVWGGNVLSKGELNVSPVKKKTIKEKTRYFGSFGELGVFAGDSGNFANGAALGYRGIHQWNEDSKNVLLPSYLGRNKEGLEEIGGGSGTSMGELKNTIGIDGAIRGIKDFADALGGKYCGDDPSGCPNSVEVSVDICKNSGSCSEDVDNNTIIINSGMNVIVKRDGNVVISTNVQYRNSSYSSFSEVPRFIVIANNIEIGCGVKRIDGLLVATGTVNTCKSDTPEDREKEDHSNQLIVNGAIIANRLVANRTYGAGPEIYSIVPAEIVRFDPTLLDLDLGSNDSNPRIVNITELPPRY